MPIVGDSPRSVFEQFREHISELICATLHQHAHVQLEQHRDDAVRTLECKFDGSSTLEIDVDGRPIYFYLGQGLRAVKTGRREFRLQTDKYWYRLQDKPGPREPTLLRWDYDRALRDHHPPYPRHHIQLAAQLHRPQDTEPLDLNRLHVPSGWVTIEEVVRFLIVEFGLPPPCGPSRWDELLRRSETAFFEKFTSKRS